MSVSNTEFDREFLDVLQKLDVNPGDCLMIHTAARDLLRSNNVEPDRILDMLIEYLGPDGTLLVPTINFDWCEGAPFDYRETPSQMGVITEIARTDPRFKRTPHAIYSFAVTGKHSETVTRNDHPSAYGIGSPFHHLHQLDGKILVVGMPWKYAITFFHYVEEMANVPYRYHKSFPGKYRRADGGWEDREYFMYARRIELGVTTDVGHVEPDFIKRGLGRQVDRLGTYFTSIGAKEFFDEVMLQLENDPYYLHSIEKD